MAMLVSDAGKLNRKCKFYAKEEVETKRGTIRIEEVFKFSCWCNIRQARISEIQEAMGTGHKSRATIIIRSQQKYDVQNDWVVEVNGRKHQSSAYVPDLDKRQFDMVILEDLF